MLPWSDALRAVIGVKVADMVSKLTESNEQAVTDAYAATAKKAMDETVKAQITENVKKWAEVTKDSVVKSLQDEIETMLQGAYDENMSTQELGRKMDDLIDGRGELIARTEVNKSIGTGKFMAYKANGTKYKQWIHSGGGKFSREWHEDFDAMGPVPIDEPYPSEYGDIMFPGDPNADPGDLCNCRCSISEADGPDEEDYND